ncbi:hypothetical protein PR202_ga13808 [Eleusine coracana subsp. coracana]|uniref:ATPase AAA-type core domain-containing protein n=1 Tax=Eleusine coracana subsp. coracana TaxID=191504 RepID=A0AAV5CFH2_ELECO|nr:hypothetical protein PR202_ga13808 [Eleusine coracana subsp. coracana]
MRKSMDASGSSGLCLSPGKGAKTSSCADVDRPIAAWLAADVFQELHDQVMDASARGRGLAERTKQLEDDLHPLIDQEDFLIYDAAAPPPDTDGDGACLTRYTNPSFISTISAATKRVSSRRLLVGSRSCNGVARVVCTIIVVVGELSAQGLDAAPSRRVQRLSVQQQSTSSSSKVTLSGLLNFIDGLWSACSGERIIVFTTNHVDRLDPALIRRGHMDRHIEMSYCRAQAPQGGGDDDGRRRREPHA